MKLSTLPTFVLLLSLWFVGLTVSLHSAEVSGSVRLDSEDSVFTDTPIYIDTTRYILPDVIERNMGRDSMGYVNERNDTIVQVRQFGTWWYGITIGTSFIANFGSLYLPRKDVAPYDSIYRDVINFTGGNGYGWFVGLTGDWQKPGKRWGGSLSLIYENRSLFTDATPINKQDVREFQTSSNFQYLTVMPSVRYNLDIGDLPPGLFLMGGLSAEILVSSFSQFFQVQDNTSQIDILRRVSTNPLSRLTIHAGAGWDIVVADNMETQRFKISPYIVATVGTTQAGFLESSWNNTFLRAGVTVKIGDDEILMSKRYPYDPSIQRTIAVLSKLSDDKIEFIGGIVSTNKFPILASVVTSENEIRGRTLTGNLAYGFVTYESAPAEPKRVPVVVAQNENKNTLDNIGTVVQPTTGRPASVTINFTPTGLNPSNTGNLTKIIEYMKANPNARIAIEGHTDSDFEGNKQSASTTRAQAVARIFLNQGIALNRITVAGRSDTRPAKQPATDNSNNRVSVFFR
jgi:outer membrane protein OmpA-like peptidoglycan-associated protein